MYNHEYYMKRAIELAKRGWGKTNPNPLVGAVIVNNDRVVSEGFHEIVGCAHAEVAAINNTNSSLAGSTMYVNLEPCSHYGRTPPCTKAIIEAGIKKVVIAMIDPNPKVSGRGVNILKEAGLEVEVGVLESEAKILNEIFINYVVKRKPFVIMKTAMTLDGKIASSSGHSKWITGTQARRHVHTLRDRVAAIMVGSNTVIKDNPFLTTRLEEKEGQDPLRVIVDGQGIVPESSNVFNSDSKAPAILATTCSIDKDKEERLTKKGVKVIKTEGRHVNLDQLMCELYKINIDSVLLEGGGNLNSHAICSKIVDKAMFFIAPKIIGGKNAVTPVEGGGINKMQDALELKDISLSKFGNDILIEGYFKE
ncbi:bifunctional diaminohydroxyphosphoribosylaminopyrimidine deaminase/5-amino-6-(5-phosphoribosylamino)uracil reductase RibD [Herbivorax sp. ANBcel31]|uniref:bifunctional diaminohydroxyphosphoribosylaminopyrimidine deaminase/5-amino-6-(5-phosphoribosylamino)uracil reductase RibD n=1 Tax=Herbivorax sp. ANBcel31 TaxID=3069754 RepID=UPI0027B3551B|nr:bifunctional diaminohydroxyphosphoribosylaminopyrimidine deaminase/5-amino-6-(5-phosphoribosylamino)uracil reductase RibD [Herbivorax sp. ANBcel31]MDQ2085724.1 bifunctional diaminohydroxyphosphoribosylaminopyrimidine deaminase/5-amino-6-(5-phosphoribosylamino)uracil reductase RibD [Herbivorax sp. ANBcel31]